MAVTVTSVDKHSIAEKNKIKANDVLLSINGNDINDVLDFMFYVCECRVELKMSRKGKEFTVVIDKDEYDELGLEFESFLMDKKQSCCNKCIFCFIDQMPPGMRETLYFKDDDERLSFLQGNYVTLTNLDDKDVERIIKMHLNINVSVHTTNPELRVKMMKNKFAGEKLKYLKKLTDAGIMLNCQIVLCPGINDGDELKRTLNDLSAMMPNIQSIACVPVGLTKFRDGLYPLELYNKETAANAIDIMESFQKKFLKEHGTRLIFPADEFYITAKRPIPEAEVYEGYPQYENGVGMVRSLIDEFNDELEITDFHKKSRNVSIVTGVLAYNFMSQLIEKANKKWHNFNCKVYCVKNYFFGEDITVTGLLTGQDLISQLKEKDLGEVLYISSDMLKSGTDLFLDDYTVPMVEKELGIKIKTVKTDGHELLNAILGNKK